MPVTRAVAFVPAGELNEAFAAQCLEHCRHRGYEVAALVRGDWAVAQKLIAEGRATVIVFARHEHCDPNWEPRVEYCTEDTIRLVEGKTPRPLAGAERRPRRVR